MAKYNNSAFEKAVIDSLTKDYPMFADLTNNGKSDNFDICDNGEVWVNGCVQFQSGINIDQFVY